MRNRLLGFTRDAVQRERETTEPAEEGVGGSRRSPEEGSALMRSLLSLGRARGAAAKTVDGRGVAATGWSVRGAAFVLTLGVSLAISAPALAATPETPETGHASAVTANTATLEGGVLNPNAAGEAGEYEYLYKASETECEGGSVAPIPEGIALGIEKEAVPPVKLTGLKAAQPYTFCLVERNAANPEEVSAASAPVTFTTLNGQPAIESEYVSYVEGSAATLNARIDPDGEATTYYFQYGTSESYGESTPQVALPENDTAMTRIPAAGMSALQPGRTYHYHVVAVNALSPAGGTPGADKTFTTPAAPGSEPAQNCANEQRRAEQPYALALPDCRAYEMVSPLNTLGQDATDSFIDPVPRASVSGEAVTYASQGDFGEPGGNQVEDQFLSRRGSDGWLTQAITPLQNPLQTHTLTGYRARDFTPELTAGIATSDAALTSDAPKNVEAGDHSKEYISLYVASFADNTYRFLVGKEYFSESFLGNPDGSSTDLSHVVFGAPENSELLSEWVNGHVVPVGVTNAGERLSASVGGMTGSGNDVAVDEREAWHAVSADGSRVYFTSPGIRAANAGPGEKNYVAGQLYVRVNADQPQSPIVSQEASGTGTLTQGSNTVTSLVAAAGLVAAEVHPGASEIPVTTSVGKFVVGQPLAEGAGIAPGTTITAIAGNKLSLSTPTTATIAGGREVSSEGPAPFTVGQAISGNGIPRGTTVTAIAPGSLTLSAPAASSDNTVALTEGGGCTVSTDACTIEVSASQRLLANSGGARTARYWGAGADGAKVFFTSEAELTEDAYTGPAGNGANLYEYDLQRPEGERLKDLTVDKTDTDGAGVLGVAQISEDGGYVYFVAEGDLAGKAVAGKPNLYVSHEGGAPVFITTLAATDAQIWGTGGGPVTNSAVVSPSGNRMAFISGESLTGYDNERAEPGQCEGRVGDTAQGGCGEIFLYEAATGSLVCASCDPSGARPVGSSTFTQPLEENAEFALYRVRNLLDDGSLFFDSADALVPHASDARANVYEYKNGHVYPISDVAGGYESFFLDASPDGQNVFFGTADQLLPQDTSNNVVVYDARVGGGFPVSVAPPPCDNGDSCKPPPAPQSSVFGAPASAVFSGPGNMAPTAAAKPAVKAKAKKARCRKGYQKRRGKCVKKAGSKRKAGKSSHRKGSK